MKLRNEIIFLFPLEVTAISFPLSYTIQCQEQNSLIGEQKPSTHQSLLETARADGRCQFKLPRKFGCPGRYVSRTLGANRQRMLAAAPPEGLPGSGARPGTSAALSMAVPHGRGSGGARQPGCPSSGARAPQIRREDARQDVPPRCPPSTTRRIPASGPPPQALQAGVQGILEAAGGSRRDWLTPGAQADPVGLGRAHGSCSGRARPPHRGPPRPRRGRARARPPGPSPSAPRRRAGRPPTPTAPRFPSPIDHRDTRRIWGGQPGGAGSPRRDVNSSWRGTGGFGTPRRPRHQHNDGHPVRRWTGGGHGPPPESPARSAARPRRTDAPAFPAGLSVSPTDADGAPP